MNHDTIQPQKDVLYLLELPVEMILLVFEYLSDVDAVYFALACRATFSIICQNIALLDPEAQTILLIRLEKYLPGFISSCGWNKPVPFDCNSDVAPRFRIMLLRDS